MFDINRRSTLTLGLAAAAATPLFGFVRPVGAAIPVYGPNDGTVLSPGVRWVDIGEVESQIEAYKKVTFGDAIYEPGAADPVDQPLMDKDMFCYILQSDFKVQKAGIAAYIVKQGECYTCGKGKSDQGTNIGTGIGIMRVAMFEPA